MSVPDIVCYILLTCSQIDMNIIKKALSLVNLSTSSLINYLYFTYYRNTVVSYDPVMELRRALDKLGKVTQG